MDKTEVLSFNISISQDSENKLLMGQYKIKDESFRIFFFEKLMKRVNIYQINLLKQECKGPRFINIDFIQNKIDLLNSMLAAPHNTVTPSKSNTTENPKAVDNFDELLERQKVSKSEYIEGNRFKIKLMSINNIYYNSEVLVVFDGYNIHKFIEDIDNE